MTADVVDLPVPPLDLETAMKQLEQRIERTESLNAELRKQRDDALLVALVATRDRDALIEVVAKLGAHVILTEAVRSVRAG